MKFQNSLFDAMISFKVILCIQILKKEKNPNFFSEFWD